jgi:hypothetical protein
MSGDWAYHELLQIAAVELTILGLAVALYVIGRSHCLFPLRCFDACFVPQADI